MRLGDRFAWCLEVQIAWHNNLDALRGALAAVVDHNEAVVALNDATDELDRAEATELIVALEERADDLMTRPTNPTARPMTPLERSSRKPSPPSSPPKTPTRRLTRPLGTPSPRRPRPLSET